MDLLANLIGLEVWAEFRSPDWDPSIDRFYTRRFLQGTVVKSSQDAILGQTVQLDNKKIYALAEVHSKIQFPPGALSEKIQCPLCQAVVNTSSKKTFRVHVLPGTRSSCPGSFQFPHTVKLDLENHQKAYQVWLAEACVSNASSCGKRCFATEEEAELIETKLVRKHLSRPRPEGRNFVRHYFCDICSGWHVTSMSKEIYDKLNAGS